MVHAPGEVAEVNLTSVELVRAFAARGALGAIGASDGHVDAERAAVNLLRMRQVGAGRGGQRVGA